MIVICGRLSLLGSLPVGHDLRGGFEIDRGYAGVPVFFDFSRDRDNDAFEFIEVEFGTWGNIRICYGEKLL